MLGCAIYGTRVRQDILAWGGGLVEIKGPRDIGPQLMHQTVLEFAMSLDFKRIVFGDLAEFTEGNGHSFHLKYWSMTYDWERNNHILVMDTVARDEILYRPRGSKDRDVYDHIGFHAEHSEITTGRSHYEFLRSMCLGGAAEMTADREEELVSFIASYGLNLCLRAWITDAQSQRRGAGWNVFNKFYAVWPSVAMPIVAALVITPLRGAFERRYLTTMQLLLEHGYRLRDDEDFFSCFDRPTWNERLNDRPVKIRLEMLLMLANIALGSGAQSDTPPADSTAAGPAERRAVRILRQGVDPNIPDMTGRTLLDWTVSAAPWRVAIKAQARFQES